MSVCLSILSAVLFALAAPPIDAWPLALVALVPFYFAIRDAGFWKGAGLSGTTAFLAIGIVSRWWVPLLQQFAHLSLFASLAITVGLVFYQTLPYALWGGICCGLRRWYGLSWLLIGPLTLFLLEPLFIFPFKFYLAITLWKVWPLTQIAEIGGPAAVSALLVLMNFLLAQLLWAAFRRERLSKAWMRGGIAVLLILGFGLARVAQISWVRRSSPSVSVGIVQPNFGILSMEERQQNGSQSIRALRDATRQLAERKVDLIVWPESAWPYLFDRTMKREFPSGHPWELRGGASVPLLFGSLTHTFGTEVVYNSAIFVGSNGDLAGRYDKNHRVPFGEYIPFATRFPAWAKRVRARLPDSPAVVAGSELSLLGEGSLRVAPLICSEDLKSFFVRRWSRLRPDLLVALANDAWFGQSGAPEQHFALASFRAIETRRDLIRATNTGLSGWITACGRVQQLGSSSKPEAAPEMLNAQVALVETFPCGPFCAAGLPWLAFCALLICVIRAEQMQSRRNEG